MRVYLKILIGIGVVTALVAITVELRLLWDRWQANDIKKMETQGQWLIQKVEDYRKIHHKLPVYMNDMKLDLPDDYPINYDLTKDSNIYVISFQVYAFKSATYYSDTKKWQLP